jgi:hypothetical protein
VLGRDATSLFCAALLALGALALLIARSVQAQAAGEEQARVVFVMPALDASTRAQLQDALYAQLSLVDAELVVLDDAEGRDPNELADAERARAVLWLDTTAGERWLLHILDVAQGRKVVRRIDAREGQRSAALDAVAVLAREASRGGPLIEQDPAEPDEPPAEQPAAPPAAPEPEAPEPEPPASEPEVDQPPPTARVSLFYGGVDFAPETAFSHGAGLSARFDWHTGFFAGASAAWAALAKPPGPLVVQRIPLGAAVGYRLRLRENLWVDLELGFFVELLFRSTRGPGADQTDGLRSLAGAAPRLRGEYRPLKLLGFFASFGLDWAVTTLAYKSKDEPPETLLSPNRVRPALEAGVAFYP